MGRRVGSDFDDANDGGDRSRSSEQEHATLTSVRMPGWPYALVFLGVCILLFLGMVLLADRGA
jgi:hypothetical protein